MQSFSRTTRLVRSLGSYSSRISESNSVVSRSARNELDSAVLSNGLHRSFTTQSPFSLGNSSIRTDFLKFSNVSSVNSTSLLYRSARPGFHFESMTRHSLSSRFYATTEDSGNSVAQDASLPDVAPRIKYKRLDKTARHIMQILDKEAVGEVKERREIPDIQPGYIIELKVEIPENKRRISTLKGIVIARRNAGLNTTFRLRRLVAGVGIESLFPLYSPNIKEIKVLDKKKVRRAKLYYLRDRMNPLRK